MYKKIELLYNIYIVNKFGPEFNQPPFLPAVEKHNVDIDASTLRKLILRLTLSNDPDRFYQVLSQNYKPFSPQDFEDLIDLSNLATSEPIRLKMDHPVLPDMDVLLDPSIVQGVIFGSLSEAEPDSIGPIKDVVENFLSSGIVNDLTLLGISNEFERLRCFGTLQENHLGEVELITITVDSNLMLGDNGQGIKTQIFQQVTDPGLSF